MMNKTAMKVNNTENVPLRLVSRRVEELKALRCGSGV